jgi:hypothetical protein
VKKIIFLDIDGVLQPYGSELRFKHKLREERDELAKTDPVYASMCAYDIGACRYDWEPGAVNYLQRLCNECNADIVITSDWKSFNKRLEMLQALFRFYDLHERVIAMTITPPDSHDRVDEVKNYVDENINEISHFVILDDRFVSSFESVFPDNFVYSDDSYLRERHFLAAKRILGG